MRFEADLSFLFSGDLQPSLILSCVQISPTPQPILCTGSANELQHGFVADQRLPSPIPFDMTKQVVLNRIPFGGAGWQMRHGNGQAKLVSQVLQSQLPQPAPIAIG